LYRDYARALAAALRRRLLPDDALDPQHPATAASLHGLLASEDGRDVRLGLDLLPGMWAAGARDELSRLAADPRPDVRLSALARLAREGDADARHRLGEEVAAHVRDPDPSVRAEALAAVTATDTALVGEVVAGLDDPETAGAAVEAIGRLGDAVLPVVTAALAEAREPVPPRTLRLVRAVRSASPENAAACLAGHVSHPDRELGLAVLSALAATRVDAVPLEATLHQTLREDAEHAARCLATLAALAPSPVLGRALRDELDLLRDRVLALLAVRHGAETIDAVALGLRDEDERRSFAVEMLEVALDRGEAALALPVVRTDLPDAERLSLLAGVLDAGRPAKLSGLVEDDEGCWRSEWLRACAAYEMRTARSSAGSIGA
jgi:HEAT repeat protein